MQSWGEGVLLWALPPGTVKVKIPERSPDESGREARVIIVKHAHGLLHNNGWERTVLPLQPLLPFQSNLKVKKIINKG